MRKIAPLLIALLAIAAPAPAATTEVDVQDSQFEPAEVEITVGDTVHWTQSGSAAHSVTADDGSFDSHPNCSAEDTGDCMGEGDEFSHAFDEAGTFEYHCKVHEETGMVGSITVQAAASDDDEEPAPGDDDEEQADTSEEEQEEEQPAVRQDVEGDEIAKTGVSLPIVPAASFLGAAAVLAVSGRALRRR